MRYWDAIDGLTCLTWRALLVFAVIGAVSDKLSLLLNSMVPDPKPYIIHMPHWYLWSDMAISIVVFWCIGARVWRSRP